MAEQSLGTLTLDIGQLKKQIGEINAELGKIGVGMDLEKIMTDRISTALENLKNEAKKAGEEMEKAMHVGAVGGQTGQGLSQAASEIAKVTSEVTRFAHGVDDNGDAIERMVSRTVTGYDTLGNKVRELYNGNDMLVASSVETIQKETDMDAVLKQMVKTYQDLYNAQAQIARLNNAPGSEGALARMQAEEAAIQRKINSMKELYPVMDMVAKENEQVVSAQQRVAMEAEKGNIEKMVALYRELYRNMTNMTKSGNDPIMNEYYSNKVMEITRSIDELNKKSVEGHKTLKEQAQEYQSVIREMERYNEAQVKMVAGKSAQAEASNEKEEAETLSKLIDLKVKKINLDRQVIQEISKGNIDNANMYLREEEEIEKSIAKIEEKNQALKEQAELNERVHTAQVAWEKAANDAQRKSSQIDEKQKTEDMKRYADALVQANEAQANLNRQLASGRIKEGSDQYAEMVNNIEALRDRADAYGSKLDASSRASAEGLDRVADSMARLRESEKQLSDVTYAQEQERYVAQTKLAYQELTTAIKNYNIAKKSGDTDQQTYWQGAIDRAMQYINIIQQAIDAGKLEADNKSQVLDIIEQMKTAYQGYNREQQSGMTNSGFLNWGNQITSYITRMTSLLTIIRTIKNTVSYMVDYVSEFSDKMNEIQVITGKSDKQIDQLSSKYRQMAKDLNVSSKDVADAAVYFTRQGLGDADIESRMEAVTKYAKTANVEFTQASEIMTSVINSMDLVSQEAEDGRDAAQRVADVFLLVGDSAATSGQEIGEAMQKAAAAAGQFGVSFEWLASYIATVSETTRQEATTIGTAFNTIIARLHSIRTTGYNSEDEMKINDIQKALKNINVTLLDQEGNWRDMTDIFTDVASQWNDLDDKTRSYIATTMAGVKQQNVFLALMSDLSKGLEGGSRAFELYEKAMNSAGTAQEKYDTFLKSVTASQNKLEIAKENFAALMDETVVKNWNNALAGAIEGVTNIIKVMTQSDYEKFGEILSESQSRLDTAMQRQKTFNQIMQSSEKTMDGNIANIEDYYSALENIASVSPVASQALDQMKSGALTQAEAFRILAQEIQNAIDKERNFSMMSLLGQNASWNPSSSGNKSLSNYMKTWTDTVLKTEGMSENEYFGQRLKNAYEIRQYGVVENMSGEMLRFVRNLVDKMTQATGSVDWTTIGNLFWSEFADGLTMNGTVEEMMKQEIEQTLDNTMAVIERSYNIDSDTSAALRKKMWTAIVGEDGKLDSDEYAQHTKAINTILNQLIGGVDVEKVIGSTDLANVIAGQLFDESAFKGLFEEQGETFAQNFVDGYKTLIKSGFSQDEIKGLMEESGIFAWDEILNQAQSHMLQGFADMLEKEDLLEWNEMWGQLDLSMLRTIKSLVDAGVSIQDIDDMLYNAKGIEDFTEQIEHLGEEKGIEQTGEELETVAKSMKDILDNVKSSSADIQKLDEMIETLSKGGEIKRSDLLDLAQSYPSLLLYANGVTNLSTGLKSLREELEKTQREELTKSLLDSEEFMKLTDYANTGYQTLQEYIDALRSDGMDDAADAVTAFANSIVTGFLSMSDATDTASNSVKGIESALDHFKTKTDKIESLNSMIESLKSGGGIGIEDILGLAKDNRGLLKVISETDDLTGSLENLRDSMIKVRKSAMVDDFLEDEGLMRLFNYPTNAKTLKDYIHELGDTTPAAQEVKNKIVAIVDALFDLDNQSGETAESMDDIFKNFKTATDEMDKLGTAIRSIREEGKIDFADLLDIGAAHPEIMMYVNDLDAMATVMERIQGDTEEAAKHNLRDSLLKSEEFMKLTDYATDAKTLGEYLNKLGAGPESNAIMGWLDNLIAKLIQLQQAGNDATQTFKEWLQEQADQASLDSESSYASATGYIEQIDALMTAMSEGGGQKALEVYEGFNETIRKGINSEYPGLLQALNDISKASEKGAAGMEDMEDAAQDMNRELNKAKTMATAKYFKDTWKAISDLTKGTITAADAYDKFYGEVDKVTKAQEEIRKSQNKLAEGTELTVSDVNDLAGVLGITAQKVLDDFPGAIELFNEMMAAGQETFDALNREATMRILGIGDADFSQLMSGMMAVQNTASSTVQALLALGQFELDTKELEEEADFPILNADGKGVHIEHATAGATYTFLKPTGSNPFGASLSGGGGGGGSGGGGGGGGGGGNKNKNSMTEVERMLDKMGQMKQIQDDMRSYYEAQGGYNESKGYLQGVIKYNDKQIEVLKDQNKTLKSYVDEIEKHLEEKRKELDALDINDENYEEVRDDVEKLQKAYVSYTEQIVKNKKAVVDLNKANKDIDNQIRDMIIDIKDEIYQAIEDREARKKAMQQAEIDMQNEILAIIKNRYEKEKEHILQVTEKKIAALEKEKSLLSEQLNLRKEMEEAEEKSAKLAEYEAQYQRIVADPTRAKEAQEIQKKIADLRKELAWDAAEKEVEAQQKSLDEQIEDLNDYKENVEDTYKELFEHPDKLIKEMKKVMAGTDDEIIAWLKKNSEDYAASTAETKAQMVKDWQEILDGRKGITTNYWEEVNKIYNDGDAAILNFLKENNEQYRTAGAEQAAAYVDAWKEKLTNLHNALVDIQTEATKAMKVLEPAGDEGDGKNTTGGGDTGSNGGKKNDSIMYGYKFSDKNSDLDYDSGKIYKTKDEALTAGTVKRNAIVAGYTAHGDYGKLAQISSVNTYLKGGLVSDTGIIQIDGSDMRPERILSPYQTQLFETMVEALERASRVNVPTLANFAGVQQTAGAQNVTFGDIVVNVEKLEDDADYEELAEKVSEVLQDKMGRMAPVGGIRLNA